MLKDVGITVPRCRETSAACIQHSSAIESERRQALYDQVHYDTMSALGYNECTKIQ